MNRRLARAVVVAMALAGCGADDVVDAPLADFAFTAPDGFAELVPGSTVAIGWTVTAAPSVSLALGAVATGQPELVLARQELASGALAWDGRGVDGVAAPAGNYTLRATALGPDDGALDTVDGGAVHLVVVQGVRFRDAALAFTGAQVSRELVLTTATRSTLELTLVLDPDRGVTGDELPLATASIPGEFAPIARSYPFTGRTADDRPIAAGSYLLAAQLRARGGAVTYRVDGPTLTWTP